MNSHQLTAFLFAEKRKNATKAKGKAKETMEKKNKSKSQNKKKPSTTKEASKNPSMDSSTARTLSEMSKIKKESTQKANKESIGLDLPVVLTKVNPEKSGGVKSETTKEVNKKVC